MVEATQVMFVEAVHETHEMGVRWLYVGSDLPVGVDFRRVPLAMAVGQFAVDGQHRHGTGEER